jgi:thiamine-phosphate pyrophosphorylase
MKWSFTAAAERALAEAAGWSSRADRDELDAPELLLGLLAEEECRAAQLLLAVGLSTAHVTERWPRLTRSTNGSRRDFSPAVTGAIEAAVERLWDYPRPLALATEHLLLGLAASPGETADWLAEHGLRADELETHIHGLYGHESGPLPVDGTDDSAAANAVEEVAAEVLATTSQHVMPVEQVADAERPPLTLPSPEGRGVEDAPPHGPRSEVSHVDSRLLRVIDAAANRAREGLRVVEDFVRMVLDNRDLTSELKQLRHELTRALEPFSYRDLLAARDTLRDVGTTVTTDTEFARSDLAAVVTANWKRLQEALRSLEEYAKVTEPGAAAIFERLRYRTYTLEQTVDAAQAMCRRLDAVRLCVLVDGCRGNLLACTELVDKLVAAGVGMIQLRDKKLSDRELLAWARELMTRAKDRDTLVIINDRVDIAAAVHADGVHLGQDDLSISAARNILGPRALIGRSTHSIVQAREAVLEGADYIGVGPTFPSTTKQFDAFTGVELLRSVAEEIRLPAFAIGGIALTNLDEVLQCGFTRVAVSGAVIAAADPAQAAAEFVARLNVAR